MSRRLDEIALSENSIVDRVQSAYGAIAEQQIDVNAAYARFRCHLLIDQAESHRRRMRYRSRRVIQFAVAIGVIAASALSAVAVRPDGIAARRVISATASSPVPSHAKFYSAGAIPVEGGQHFRAANHKKRKVIPPSIQRGKQVIDRTYQLIPRSTRLTAVIPASGRGRKSLCSWILAVGRGPAKAFHASPSAAMKVVIPLNGARTLRIKSLPPRSDTAPGPCAISQIQVVSAPPPANWSAPTAPVSPASPTMPSSSGSPAPSPQNTEATG